MAAKPLVLYESRRPGRAGLRGDRDPRRSSTTRSTPTTRTRRRCWCGSASRRARDHLRRPRAGRARRRAVPKIVRDRRRRRPCSTPATLTTRQINLELRRLLYEQGIADVTVRNPGAKHSLGVGILHPLQDHLRGQPRLLRLRPDRRARDPHQRPRRLVGLREHDVRRRRHRRQRRLADRRGAARRRPRRQGPRRRPHRHRPEGRHDHHRRHRSAR